MTQPAVNQAPERPTAKTYATVFEGNKDAAAILEDLIKRFVRDPVFEGGIDGVRKSDYRAGSRAVMDFIVKKINQAHGVEDDVEPDQEQ